MSATTKGVPLTKAKAVVAAVTASVISAAVVVVVADAGTGPAQIRISDVEVSKTLIRPRRGGPVGTVEIVSQRLYNPSLSSRAIGTGQIVCTYVGRTNRTCISTYTLPKGMVVVAGAVQSRLLYEQAIIGGTGLFDNARGSLTVTASHLRPRREVLVFRLLG